MREPIFSYESQWSLVKLIYLVGIVMRIGSTFDSLMCIRTFW